MEEGKNLIEKNGITIIGAINHPKYHKIEMEYYYTDPYCKNNLKQAIKKFKNVKLKKSKDIDTLNEKVNGTVTLRMYKGHCDVVALKTPQALFDEKLATFMKSDLFNQNASPGFTELWTLQMKMAKQTTKNILVTIGGAENKDKLREDMKALAEAGCVLYATEHTSEYMDANGILNRLVHKISTGKRPNIGTLMRERRFDLIINIPAAERNFVANTDGELIRELAIKHNVQVVTSIDVARHTVQELKEKILNKMH